MRNKSSLFRGAALGALIALGIGGAAAQAKTHSTSEAARIQALEAQVQALTDRLNAQAATQQQAAAAAQSAAQSAQAAQAAQAQADDGIKTIPAQVQSAVAALPQPKPGWEANTKISGRMYYDVTNISQKSNGVKQASNGTQFDVKRFYFGVDHKFNDIFSANLTTDFTYDSGVGATQIYVKKAYLDANLSPMLDIRLGSTDLPWVPFAEDMYGYRYVENVMIDRTKFGTSADWGVHAKGSFPAGMAKISYAISAVNGAGYKKPGLGGTTNRGKGIDVEGRLSADVSHFTVAVGGYTGKLGKDVQGVATFNTAQRFDALAAYHDDRIRLGVEYFAASDWNDVTNPGATNSSEGISGFGSFKFTPKFSVFGRYDWVKPKRDTAANLKDNYFNVGVQYSPAKIVDFALVYKRDKVDNGTIGTSNGNIGGSVSGTYDEVGLWSQFRW